MSKFPLYLSPRSAWRRPVRLSLLLLACAFVMSPIVGAGPATAPASPALTESHNPFALVLDNLDFVFLTIAALSITGLALIIHGFLRNRRDLYMPPTSVNQIRSLIESRNLDDLLTFTQADPSFLSQTLHPALRRYPHLEQMDAALETAAAEQTAEAFRRIEYLNIIGNLGPLLGLLGTVIGMIQAFQTMNLNAGHADPAQLSGGVSKALAHTMLGLLLAIPCLAAFGYLRTLVDRLTTQASIYAEELLFSLRSPATAAASSPRLTPPPPVRSTNVSSPA